MARTGSCGNSGALLAMAALGAVAWVNYRFLRAQASHTSTEQLTQDHLGVLQAALALAGFTRQQINDAFAAEWASVTKWRRVLGWVCGGGSAVAGVVSCLRLTPLAVVRLIAAHPLECVVVLATVAVITWHE